MAKSRSSIKRTSTTERYRRLATCRDAVDSHEHDRYRRPVHYTNERATSRALRYHGRRERLSRVSPQSAGRHSNQATFVARASACRIGTLADAWVKFSLASAWHATAMSHSHRTADSTA